MSWETIKHTNMFTMEDPTGKKKGNWAERMSEEIIAKNFLNLVKNLILHIQEA